MNPEIEYGCGFLSVAFCLLLKILVQIQAINTVKNCQKSMIDAIKTASRRAIQKTAEATGYLIGNKIADKITIVSKNLLKML